MNAAAGDFSAAFDFSWEFRAKHLADLTANLALWNLLKID